MTMNFLQHKDKEEKRKSGPQKQEYGCYSLQPFLSSHTNVFLSALGRQFNDMVKATTLGGANNNFNLITICTTNTLKISSILH
jgi:hypothetical protein